MDQNWGNKKAPKIVEALNVFTTEACVHLRVSDHFVGLT